MPEHKPPTGRSARNDAPCDIRVGPDGDGCALSHCVNCRREVEASLSRIACRKLRRLRHMEECSVARCMRFLRGIEDEAMRLHLASMAWWRFSADDSGAAAPLLGIMKASRAEKPGSGVAYMHSVLHVLSPLSQTQLSAWFGCENVYQVVTAFADDRPPLVGSRCSRCRLYKQGCTAYDKLGADDCPLRDDKFVQAVAAAVSKAGGWKNPCAGIEDQP